MTPKQDSRSPLETICWTVGALGAFAALAYGIPKVIIALATAAGLLAGTVAATAAPSWALFLVSIGVGGTGVTLTVRLLMEATREASKQPYEWTVPILGIAGGLILDVAKEYALDNSMLKLILSAVIAFIVVVAGACWKHGGFLSRFLAILLILAPPTVVLTHNLDPVNLAEGFRSIPGTVWFRLVAFVLFGAGVAVLQYLSAKTATRRA